MTSYEAAKLVIERVSRGVNPDEACVKCGDFDLFTRRQFFHQLRKHSDLKEEFEQAMEDWAHMEALAIISLSDELANCSDAVQIQAMTQRIKARQWMAERLVKKFQPTIKNEHSGKMTLTVVTGVPRIPEQIKDAEHRVLPPTQTDSIEDLL
tara:strand:+ start:3750 stop:4205 length:456 start_codon:yes stop_codon:yes gene_type:complete